MVTSAVTPTSASRAATRAANFGCAMSGGAAPDQLRTVGLAFCQTILKVKDIRFQIWIDATFGWVAIRCW